MTTEHAPASRCIKVGAGYACIWAIGLAYLLAIGALKLSGDGTLEMAMLIGSLAAFAVGIPALRDEKFRHPASVFFLVVGAVLVSVLFAILAAFGFLLYLFLGFSSGPHR